MSAMMSNPFVPPIHACACCGVIAPTEATGCAACGHRFAEGVRTVAGSAGGAVWACILACDVECRACGLRTPIRSLHMKSEIFCERCGLIQAFVPEDWRDALGHAHEVAMHYGPRAGSAPVLASALPAEVHLRRLRLSDVGRIVTGAESPLGFRVFGAREGLRVKAGPGHPLCARCHEPLAAAFDRSGRMQTSCGRCNERTVYVLPEGVRGFYRPLLGVIALEHRPDRPEARVDRAATGLVALRCPNCGATVNLDEGASIVTCSHCKVTSAIPQAVRSRHGSQTPFSPFWVLLAGTYEPLERMSAVERGREEAARHLALVSARSERQAQHTITPLIIALIVVVIVLVLLVNIGVAWYLFGQ